MQSAIALSHKQRVPGPDGGGTGAQNANKKGKRDVADHPAEVGKGELWVDKYTPRKYTELLSDEVSHFLQEATTTKVHIMS